MGNKAGERGMGESPLGIPLIAGEKRGKTPADDHPRALILTVTGRLAGAAFSSGGEDWRTGGIAGSTFELSSM